MSQKDKLPIYVISCPRDKDRRAAALASCAAFGAETVVVEAVDWRDGLSVFAPYADLVGPDFWAGPEIKPGAFGCFVSHRKAWAQVVSDGVDAALIMEDDSRLVAKPRVDMGSDLVFVNDRMAGWSAATGNTRLANILGSAFSPQPDRPRVQTAPGGDGYVITQQAARDLLDCSETDRIRCGVDWYLVMLAAGTHQPPSGWQAGSEPEKLLHMFGERSAALNTAPIGTVLIQNDRHWGSSIGHAVQMDIAKFQADIV